MDFSNPPVVKLWCLRCAVTMLLALMGAVLGAQAQAEPGHVPLVMAFNTYAQAPFVDDEGGGGLAADCVAYLNQKLAGTYRFQLETIPRSRLLRQELAGPAVFDGIVLFLNPRFVDDLEQQRFLWTDGLFVDANVLVFRGTTAPSIRQLNDLAGMRFGGSLDARYQGLDELVNSHAITRIDSSSLNDTLKQLAAGRVDFTQTNMTAFRALVRTRLGFVSSPMPGEPEFTRHILIGKRNADLAEHLGRIVRGMPSDPQWKAIASRYALTLPRPQTPARLQK